MTLIQLYLLTAFAILGLAMLAAIALVAAAYAKFQKERRARDSLLKRLENNPMLERPKYNKNWSQM